MATQQRGSGFVGLDKYLAANRNAAKRMSDALAGTVETAGAESESDVADVTEQYERDVAAGIPQFNENGEPLTPAELQALIDAKYTGPESLSDMAGWDAAKAKVDKTAQDAARLSSLSGRMGALQDQYGKGGGYNLGSQRLDSFLSGATGGGRFQELKDKYGALSESVGGASAASQAMSRSAADSVKAMSDKAKGIAKKNEPTGLEWVPTSGKGMDAYEKWVEALRDARKAPPANEAPSDAGGSGAGETKHWFDWEAPGRAWDALYKKFWQPKQRQGENWGAD